MPKELFDEYGVPKDPDLLQAMTNISKATQDYVDKLKEQDINIIDFFAISHILQSEIETILFFVRLQQAMLLKITHNKEESL